MSFSRKTILYCNLIVSILLISSISASIFRNPFRDKPVSVCYEEYGCFYDDRPFTSFLFDTLPDNPNKFKINFYDFNKTQKIVQSFKSKTVTVLFLDKGEKVSLNRWYSRYSGNTLQSENHVIAVDWYSAQSISKAKTITNMQILSKMIYRKFIQIVFISPEKDIENYHLNFVGLGYGAQLAGMTSERFKSSVFSIDTIIAVNPQREYFKLEENTDRLSSDDAKTVFGIYSHEKEHQINFNEATYKIFIPYNTFLDGCPNFNMDLTENLRCTHILPMEMILESSSCPFIPLNCPLNGLQSFLDGHCLNCDKTFCPTITFSQSSSTITPTSFYLKVPSSIGKCAYFYRIVMEFDYGFNVLPSTLNLIVKKKHISMNFPIKIPMFIGRKQIVQLILSSVILEPNTIDIIPGLMSIIHVRVRQVTLESITHSNPSYTFCGTEFIGPLKASFSNADRDIIKCEI
uniref:Triacyl glycerol lipase n=1 Tax=Tetracapsuloides bryosalmonae TaxID=271932 RepID=A0A859IQM3_9CNID|nr:triacyl glycerol lipase [Tetracapsuloides bryosalmonae]